ncbi:MAG TPA: Mov34/MPN/PAD-1 family protein [Candidatus Thermoplasmatota archaeon]|nr:Mov34/MPN/PAD-1 family protein [Candidatus Thermoplasmatota archaeon]
MGWFGLGRRKGTWRTIRADYRQLPITEWTEDEEAHFWKTCSEEEYWATWDEWSLDTYEHPTIRKVRRQVIDLGRAAASNSFPQEFAALLRVKGDTVTELVLLPGTVQGDAHAIFQLGMKPVDRTINGTLHSHPDEHPYPSDADFDLFSHEGAIHLIFGQPYGPDDWRAYDHTGLPTFLEVVR